MADTSMTILSQDLFRMSFLVHQAELQLMGVYPAFCFSWNLCNFNSSNIVLMDLGFSLTIMLKQVFCRGHWSCMNSVLDRLASIPDQPSGLLTWRFFCTLTSNFFEMCKNQISSRQHLVGLEFMRVEISLSLYSFSDVVVGRENRDQSLDGGGNTLPNGYVSRCE